MNGLIISNAAVNASMISEAIPPGNERERYCFIVPDLNGWQQSSIITGVSKRCIVLTNEYKLDDLCKTLSEVAPADGIIIAPLLNKRAYETIKQACIDNYISICDSWKITYKKDYLNDEAYSNEFIRSVIAYIDNRSKPAEDEYQTIELDCTENGKPKQTINNALAIFENDEKLKGKICFNVISRTIWTKCNAGENLPWREEAGNYREWESIDDSYLLYYMEQYGLKNESKIVEALQITADKKKFNPIAELLRGTKWDGKERIKTMLADYLGAERSLYNAEIMKIIMLGAISRALNPGCKFDFVMILTGPQGNGKTTFCQRLALDEIFFSNSLGSIEDRRAAELIRGKWIIELGELLAVKRAKDVEAVKSFLTQNVDDYRPAYGHRTEHFPRTCIFIGTTNANSFLTDSTGNRRFLPVDTGLLPATKNLFAQDTAEEFRQAWAEAMEIYNKGDFTLTIPDWIAEQVAEQRHRHEQEDPEAIIIEEYLENQSEVCTKQLFYKALGNDEEHPEKFSTAAARKIADIMANMKAWKKSDKKKRIAGYGTTYFWYKEENDSSEQAFIDLPLSNEDMPFN